MMGFSHVCEWVGASALMAVRLSPLVFSATSSTLCNDLQLLAEQLLHQVLDCDPIEVRGDARIPVKLPKAL